VLRVKQDYHAFSIAHDSPVEKIVFVANLKFLLERSVSSHGFGSGPSLATVARQDILIIRRIGYIFPRPEILSVGLA
jgi:hypothetical protein